MSTSSQSQKIMECVPSNSIQLYIPKTREKKKTKRDQRLKTSVMLKECTNDDKMLKLIMFPSISVSPSMQIDNRSMISTLKLTVPITTLNSIKIDNSRFIYDTPSNISTPICQSQLVPFLNSNSKEKTSTRTGEEYFDKPSITFKQPAIVLRLTHEKLNCLVYETFKPKSIRGPVVVMLSNDYPSFEKYDLSSMSISNNNSSKYDDEACCSSTNSKSHQLSENNNNDNVLMMADVTSEIESSSDVAMVNQKMSDIEVKKEEKPVGFDSQRFLNGSYFQFTPFSQRCNFNSSYESNSAKNSHRFNIEKRVILRATRRLNMAQNVSA